jgi:signal transduction histidine kinase
MSSIVKRFDTNAQPARTSAVEHPEAPGAKPSAAHAAKPAGRRVPAALAWRNWPVSWRLTAVVVVAVVLDGVLGGLRLAAAAGSTAQFGRVAQLAVLGQQVTGLAHALEDERDQTAGFIASGRPAAGMAAVQQDYAATDARARQVRSAAAGIGVAFPVSTRAKVTTVLNRIGDLGGLRDAALHTQLPSLPVITDYSESVTDLFSLNDEIAQSSADSILETNVRTLGSLSRMTEDTSVQRALLYAAFAERRFEPGALQDLITTQAAQASDLASFQASASLAQQQSFGNTVTGPSVSSALLMEQHAIQAGQPQTAGLGISSAAAPQQWDAAMSDTIRRMRQVEGQVSGSVVAQSRALRQGPVRSALLTGVLTGTILLLVLLATLVVTRSLVLPLRRLRAGALDIATSSLPARVRELGEARDPSANLDVEPIPVHSTDEIGQVARAFDLVHSEAVRLAGNEAMLRHSVSAMFVSLARRSQSLIERLAQMMQSAGQRERDPDQRSEFSAMEHLVIRMRRNSENLLVLAGFEAVRRWSGSVSLEELVQAARSEIEQHSRVDLDIAAGILVGGQAATDVVHLLAELIENAAKFSPRDTRVQVTGYEVASGGVLVEIQDRGVGVAADRLEEMNRRLDDPPEADVSVSRHMGLFAVAHLAARHGVRVRLCASPSGGGLTALVWLPDTITDRAEPAPGGWPANAYAHRPGGVPEETPVPSGQILRVGGYYLPAGGRHYGAHERLPTPSNAATPPGIPAAAASVLPERTPAARLTPAPAAPAVTLTPPPTVTVTSALAPPAAVAPVPAAPAAVAPVRAAPAAVAPVRAAEAVAAAVPGRLAATSLPVRVPQANRMPGSADLEPFQAPRPPAPPVPRSADAARSRLGGYQRGTRRAEQRITRAGERADTERTDH